MNMTAPVRLDVLLLHNALADLRSKLPVGRTMTGVEESLSLAAAILTRVVRLHSTESDKTTISRRTFSPGRC
jgi:hypothetical protein